MSRQTLTRSLAVLTLAATLLPIPPAQAQRQRVELPDEVREWLARDQVQRWAGLLEAGEKLFSEGSCARCHGQGGAEGRFGPDLTDEEWLHGDGSIEAIRWTILWGVRKEDLSDPDRPFMLPAGGLGMELSFDDLAAVAAYVWSLSNGTYLPER